MKILDLISSTDNRPPDVRRHPSLYILIDGSWMEIDHVGDYSLSMLMKDRNEMNRRWPYDSG